MRTRQKSGMSSRVEARVCLGHQVELTAVSQKVALPNGRAAPHDDGQVRRGHFRSFTKSEAMMHVEPFVSAA